MAISTAEVSQIQQVTAGVEEVELLFLLYIRVKKKKKKLDIKGNTKFLYFFYSKGAYDR